MQRELQEGLCRGVAVFPAGVSSWGWLSGLHSVPGREVKARCWK